MTDRRLRDRAAERVVDDWWKIVSFIVVVIGAVHLTELTWADFTSPPDWLVVYGTFALLAAVIGILVAVITHEPEEPDWKIFHADSASDGDFRQTLKLSPGAWQELELVGKGLRQLSEHPGEAYETREFDVDRMTSRPTWRHVPTGSDLIGQHPENVMTTIAGMRATYDLPVREADYVRNNVINIVRDLDRERSMRQTGLREDLLAPGFGESGGIDETVREHIPSEVRTDVLQEQLDAMDEAAADDVDHDDVTDDLGDEDDVDDSGPSADAADGPAETPAATDGGQDQ